MMQAINTKTHHGSKTWWCTLQLLNFIDRWVAVENSSNCIHI